MDLISRWHEALEREPGSPSTFLRQVLASGASYRGQPLCVYRRPHIISGATVKELTRSLSQFHGAVRRLRNVIIEQGLDGELVSSLGLRQGALELARIHPGYESAALVARVDCFVGPDGPKFLELNAESPAGIAYADALVQVFDRDPIRDLFPELTSFRSADAVVRAVLETWRAWGGLGLPEVAIVDFAEVPTWPEFVLFRQRFRAAGVPCSIIDPRHLEWDGTRLRHGDRIIEVVYRRVLVEDILQRPDDCRALVEAYRAGAICMVNNLRTPLLHGKGLFALLHDPTMQKLLTPTQREMVQRVIPYTVRADEAACETASRDREAWVLKPMHGHGGRGVVLGHAVDDATWEAALASADHHVLQHQVSDQRALFPDARDGYALKDCLVDLDPFLIRGRLAGFLCRLSEGPLANVSAGASQVPVYVS